MQVFKSFILLLLLVKPALQKSNFFSLEFQPFSPLLVVQIPINTIFIGVLFNFHRYKQINFNNYGFLIALLHNLQIQLIPFELAIYFLSKLSKVSVLRNL